MTDYILMGSAPLEFTELGVRVEPSDKGTPFSVDLEPGQEAQMLRMGHVILAPKASKPAKAGKE